MPYGNIFSKIHNNLYDVSCIFHQHFVEIRTMVDFKLQSVSMTIQLFEYDNFEYDNNDTYEPTGHFSRVVHLLEKVTKHLLNSTLPS